MSKPGKSSSRSRRPRESKALRRLRDALGLPPAVWQTFVRHLRDGFADYERANWPEYGEPLDLPDVPPEWFGDPEPLGYVTKRVLHENDTALAAPVTLFFLSICDPGPETLTAPPGIGLAWVYLASAGMAPPIEPARLGFLAAQSPKEFFQWVTEDDLPMLSRLILEAKGPPEVWDMHVLLAAVDRAGVHARAPYRLFHALMAADWLPAEVKREFCRGLLDCSPQAERLKERDATLHKMLESSEDWWGRFPLFWLEVARYGLRLMVPGLRRHAVFALAAHVGEPSLAVIEEFLVWPDKRDRYVEMVHQGALDVVEARAEELGPEVVRKFLQKALAGSSAVVRQAAYRIGLTRFGPEFARPAMRDSAASVRKWAMKALAQSGRRTVQPAD